MPLTIQDVRREVRTALSRVRILDSDTIEISAGSHPLQPSVKTGALSGVGDIFGPTITTPNAIAIWANSDGTALADSPILIDPATGELKLDGNKLTLSEDGLSSIQSLAPNLMAVTVNNVAVMTWTDEQIDMLVPLSVRLNALVFSVGTELKSSGTKELDLLLDSVATVSFRETFTSFATDVLLNDNVIVLSDTEEISGTGGVVTLKVADKNQVRWADNLMTLAESPGVGNVALYVVKAADAIFEGVGGTLRFQGGLGNLFASGTVQFATSNAVVRLEVNTDGTLNLNSTIFQTSGAISGVPSISLDDGGLIGVAPNDTWRVIAGTSWVCKVNSVTALTITDTELDGNSVLRLKNFAGMRETFIFGYFATSTVTSQFTYGGPYAQISGNAAKRGHWMPRPGSIISVNIVCDVNVVGSGDTLEARIRKNNIETGFDVVLAALTVADGLENENTAALGTHTFVRGDYLQGVRTLTGASPGQVTTDDFKIIVEVEYDS